MNPLGGLERRRDVARTVVAIVFSLAVHLIMTMLGRSAEVAAPASHSPVALVSVSLEPNLVLPPMRADGALDGTSAVSGGRPEPEQASPGGERTPRPDDSRAGRGGDPEASEAAVNLAPRNDEAQLSPTWRSRLERSQVSRSDTGESPRSPEDDRVSPHAMMLTFVQDGLDRPDQRPSAVARLQGALGRTGPRGRTSRALQAHPIRPNPAGADGATELAAQRAEARRAEALARSAAQQASASRHGRAGRAPRRGKARPYTVIGGESSPSNERGRQADDVSSEQEAHNVERSPLRASAAGGQAGAGRGGQHGPDQRPAAGGVQGAGFRARPNGSGYGPGNTVDPADARRRSYLRNIAQRIHSRWSVGDFPREAILAGQQGYTIVSFVVARDGSVSAVRVIRGSGFAEFDQKMRQAVFLAAPFGPLPPEMMPVLHTSHEFIVSNPAVQPPRR